MNINKSIVLKTLFLTGILMSFTYIISAYLSIKKDTELITQIKKYNLYSTNKALNIAQKNNLKNSRDDVLSYIKIIAKNYSIFFLNYDIEGLKNNVILSMNKKYIKAIKITYTIDDEVLLLAINNNNKIEFVKKFPKTIEQYEQFNTNITSKDYEGLTLNIGKLVIYYDNSHLIKKINKIKEKTKNDIKIFNETLNEKLSSSIINKLIIYILNLIIMLIIITFVLKKLINTPLQKLHNGLNNFFLFLQNKNQSIEKIQLNTNDEFGEMAKSLNENIIVSSKLHKEIYELNHNLESKIEEKTIELKEKEETYKALFYKSSDGIMLIKNNIIIDCNESSMKILQFENNLVGMFHDSLFPEYQDNNVNSKDKMQYYIKKTNKKGVCRFEWRYKKNNFEIIWVDIVLTKISIRNESIIHALIRDITLQKELQKNIIKEKEKAQEATKLKSEFLANMSHEIRTPMNGILGMTYLVLQTGLKDKQKNYIEKIDKSAKNLLGIINDILDFSKIEAGKLEIEQSNFNMYKLIDDIINIVEYKAHNKNIDLVVDYDTDMSELYYGDNLRISQVITNLLSNAIKFTHEGSICISIINLKNGKYKFEVKDTGIGIDANILNKLFKSFSQADSSITRKYGGTGLGLKISKQLVELMGGNIYVESEVNKGSTFSFEIPLKEISKKVNVNKFTGKKILIIDDNKLWHDILENILITFDVDIFHAYSGEEAINNICEKKIYYDLLLVDWNMSHLDGIQTVNIIKKRSNILPQAIIMLSSFRLESVIKLSKDAGITTFLQKPVNPSLLHDILSSLFLKDNEIKYKINKDDKLENLKNEIIKIDNFNILLTEDNEINQEIVLGILEEYNINVDIANNGKEAVDILDIEKNKYDLILMDLQMPIMDGYEATKIIRKTNNDIPIVALTANAMKEDIKNTKKIGMNDHLNKPINVLDFFKIILKYSKTKNNLTIPSFKYINTDIGLKYLVGNKKLYLKILKNFYISYKDHNLNNIEEEKIKLFIHSIKGLSANIGAISLNNIAIELEKSLDKKLFNEFNTKLSNVIDELSIFDIKD